MKNIAAWQPTKFVVYQGILSASRDLRQVPIASRIMADAVARAYDKYLPFYASGRLLDLGCGKAPLLGTYQKLVSSTTCVDWEVSLHNNPYTDIVADLNKDLPFEDASFDTIILSDVIEHVFYPHRLWGEMSRVLRPGGHIFLNTPFIYCLHETPHDYFRLTEFSLCRMSADSGLEVTRLDSLGGAFSIFGDISTRMVQRIPYVGRFLGSVIYGVVRRCLKTSACAKVESSTQATFPFGYFMVSEKPKATLESPPECAVEKLRTPVGG